MEDYDDDDEPFLLSLFIYSVASRLWPRRHSLRLTKADKGTQRHPVDIYRIRR